MSAVLQKLEEDPVTVIIQDAQTGTDQRIVISAFYARLFTVLKSYNRRSLGQLPAFYYRMAQGDFTELAHLINNLRKRPIVSAMTVAMDCASGASDDRLAHIRAEAPTTLLQGASDFLYPDVCIAWSYPDLSAAFRQPMHSEVPVLFISGTLV